MRDIDFVVLHHTGSHNPDQTVSGMKKYHTEVKGYRDISYHYIIDFDGMEYKGRNDSVPGAHAKGFNSNSIGICVFGEFGMNEVQAETLLSLCRRLMVKYDLTEDDFKRHKDLANTLCPAYDIDWLKQILAMK